MKKQLFIFDSSWLTDDIFPSLFPCCKETIKKHSSVGVWWYTPVTLGAETPRAAWSAEIQDSQGYTGSPCLKDWEG